MLKLASSAGSHNDEVTALQPARDFKLVVAIYDSSGVTRYQNNGQPEREVGRAHTFLLLASPPVT